MPKAKAGRGRRTVVASARESDEADAKQAVCVRMDQDLFELIEADARKGERTPPGQIRLILRQHYGLRTEAET